MISLFKYVRNAEILSLHNCIVYRFERNLLPLGEKASTDCRKQNFYLGDEFFLQKVLENQQISRKIEAQSLQIRNSEPKPDITVL